MQPPGQDRTEMMVQAVNEVMDCTPPEEWRSIVNKAFTNKNVEATLWPDQTFKPNEELSAAMDSYREWKGLMAAIVLPSGEAFQRDFWIRLIEQPQEVTLLEGMDMALRVYTQNLVGEIVRFFTNRERTQAEELNDAGFAHHYAGGYEEALRLHNQAIHKAPDFSLAWVNKAIALKNLGQLDEAIKCYDHVIKEIDPSFKKAWYNKGVALTLKNMLSEAVECFDQALEIDPNYTLAKQMREKCIAQLKPKSGLSSSDLLPKHPQAVQLSAMATQLLSNGNYEGARRLYEQALTFEKNPLLLAALGDILCDCDQYDQAETRYQEAIALDEKFGPAWVGMARVYLDRRDLSAALDAGLKATHYTPNDSMAWANLAAAYYALEQLGEAVSAAYKSIELDDQNCYGYFYLGFSFFFLDRFREAREALQRMIRVNPNFQGVPIAKDMLTEIDRILGSSTRR